MLDSVRLLFASGDSRSDIAEDVQSALSDTLEDVGADGGLGRAEMAHATLDALDGAVPHVIL